MLIGMISPRSRGSTTPPTDKVLLWWDNTIYWGEQDFLIWG